VMSVIREERVCEDVKIFERGTHVIIYFILCSVNSFP
jgi:hypothetical protein